MAETTTDERTTTRTEAAALLRSIADELDSGRRVVSIPLGNKNVDLSPPDSFDSTASVTERSRRLRKDTEELSLTFKWNPTEAATEPGTAGESAADPPGESDHATESDGGTDRDASTDHEDRDGDR